MPKTSRTLGSQRRWRLWTGRLWILSIVLGLGAITSSAFLIHDRTRRREAAGLIAVTTAQEIAGATHERWAPVRDALGRPLSEVPVDSARRIARRIFTAILAEHATLAALDSTSLRVTLGDSTVLFGSLAPDHTIRGSLLAGSGRDALTITVALTGDQIPHVLLMPIRHTDLWHNGILVLSTVIVTLLAFGSARREAALAGARGDFIAGVSHDLRMPLAQILLASETMTLRADLDERERSSLAQSIVRESKRLISLVENILLFSRSGAAELSPRRDIVSVRELLADAADATRLAAEDAGQSLEVNVDDALTLTGDARLLRQALVNLIDNALKYGTRGQQVTIGATRADAVVRITVDDQGPGIPRAERERVFDAYERLSRDQSSERTGTGLGLAVVSYIARASGGRVWLDDAPAGGTRAVLELPSA